VVGASTAPPLGASTIEGSQVSVKTNKTIEAAEAFISSDGGGLQFDRIDQIFDLQRLMGPVIAYKVLLDITINSADAKERRMAASRLLDSAGEDPEKIAGRLRASIFHDLSLEELQAVVQTGITDPQRAVEKLKVATG
jgi:hypothetical protein